MRLRRMNSATRGAMRVGPGCACAGLAFLNVIVAVWNGPARAEGGPASANQPVSPAPSAAIVAPSPSAPPPSAHPPTAPQAAAKGPVEASTPNSAAGTSAVVLDPSAVQGIVGRSVKTAAGEDMGRIVDLLVAPSGQVRAAVLDFGGVLGVGARRVAVDWKVLSFRELGKDGPVQVLLTRNQIRVAPEYKSNEPVVVLEAAPDAKGETDAGSKSGANTAQPQAQPSSAAPAPSHREDDRATK